MGTLTEVAGAASKLVITSTAVTTAAGVASSSITVQRQDQFGNPNTTDAARTVTLASTSTGTVTFTPASPLTISLGSSSASFTYTDTKAGTPTITAASTSPTTITSATQTETVNAAAASKLVITSTAVTTTAGVASSSITVQRQDQFGNPNTADAARTVTLASTSTGTVTFTPASPLTISLGSSSASFTYTDTKAGTPTITAASTSPTTITSATQTETVNPAAASKLAYATVPATGTAGTAFSVTVQSQDAYGNPSSPTSATTIALSKASGSGTLSGTLTGSIATSANSVTISTPVYSKSDTMTLTATATAGETSLTAVTSGGIVFSAGPATHLVFTSVPIRGTVGTAFSVTVQSQDANGNPSSPTSATTITLSKATGSGTLSGTLTGSIATTTNSITISTPVYSAADTLTLTATATAGETSLTPVTSGGIVFDAPYRINATSTDTTRGGTITIRENGANNAIYVGVIVIAVSNTVTHQAWTRDSICVDLFTNISLNTWYGSTILSPADISGRNTPRVAWLVDNAILPAQNTNYTSQLPQSDWVTNAAMGEGLQLAIWDIVEDGGDGLYSGSVQASTGTPTPAAVIFWATNYEALSLGKSSYSAYVYNNVILSGGTSAQTLMGPEFTNGPAPGATFSIGNRVFYDANHNGFRDSGEPGIPNTVMDLYAADGSGNPTGSALAMTITDANGYYRFDGLLAGTYVAVVDVIGSGTNLNGMITSTGWSTNLALAGDNQDHGIDTPLGGLSVLPGGIASVPVQVGIGLQPTGDATFGAGAGANGSNGDTNDNLVVDFGFNGNASIDGSVLVDVNGNGIADSNDTNGIAGVTVTLQTTSGAAIATTVTSASGAYSFTSLLPGSYVVVETNLPGRISTLDTAPPNDDRIPVTLTSGQASTGNNFYDTQLAQISGNVLVDVNGNGVANTEDTNGIAGVTVTLQTTNGVVVATNLTSASGRYVFTNVAPGSYVVVETNLPGWISTLDTAPPNDDHIPLTLVSGQSSTGNNFLDTQPVTIGDYVWVDSNGNGVQDGGEPGLGGVQMVLYRTNSGLGTLTAVVTNTSSGAGIYSFTNVVAGDFVVGFGLPSGYAYTVANAGGNTNLDSNAATGNGLTAVFTLTTGQTNNTIDAGYYQATSISGKVLVDVNGNGTQDAADTNGIASVTITLKTNGVTVATMQTDGSGNYSFTNLAPGSYVVVETDPVGYLSTGDTQGVNDNQIAVTLVSGTPSSGNNFLDTQPVTIGDYVWVDSNGNGVQDGGEPGLSGVQVILYRTNSGLGTLTAVATNTSSGAGAYSFTNVVSGDFVVGFGLPSGYAYTTANAGGNTNMDSNAVTGNGQTAVFTMSTGQTNNTVDAGYYQATSIGGKVLVDVNGNGIADTEDTNGIAGVIVTLQTTGGVVLGTNVTSASGAYSFTNLPPGSYVVVETNLAGRISTLDTAPPNDDHIQVTLTSGQTSTGNNFYDMQLAQITGSVKLDVNGNGTADSADTNGISPVVLKVYQGGTNLVATVTNNPDGSFAVSSLPPGGYTVVQTVPPGYTNTTPLTVNVTLTSGSTGTANYLDTLTFSIGNRVFNDNGAGGGTANNGIKDGAEPGIANVIMKLYAANGSGNPTGSVVATTITDASGYYRFDGLPAGTYVVVVDVFGSGAALNGMVTSTGWNTNLTLAGDLRDHGKDAPLVGGSVLPGGIASMPVQVGIGLQPTGEAIYGLGAGTNGPGGDASDNLVVDFGFYSPPPTAAVMAWLGAFVDTNGRVWVTWQTLSEDKVLYFDVLRTSSSAVTTDVTPGLVDSIGGQDFGYLYRVQDKDTTMELPGKYTYSLVGWNSDGSTNVLAYATVNLAANNPGVIRITGIQAQTSGILVQWVGGQPPYTLETQTNPGGNWMPVGPAQPGETEAVVPANGSSGLFRVKGGGE